MNLNKCKLTYGDRVYARLCQNGQQIAEFVMERVGDMTEILGEIRRYTRKYKGLCRLYLRNMSRGWSMEQPLMLYPESYHTPSGWREYNNAATEVAPTQRRRPIFPWETH